MLINHWKYVKLNRVCIHIKLNLRRWVTCILRCLHSLIIWYLGWLGIIGFDLSKKYTRNSNLPVLSSLFSVFNSSRSKATSCLGWSLHFDSFNFERPSVFRNMPIGCMLAKMDFNSFKCLNGSYFRHPSYFGFFIWSIGTQVLLINPVCTVGYTVVTWRFFRDRIPYPLKRFYFWLLLITFG